MTGLTGRPTWRSPYDVRVRIPRVRLSRHRVRQRPLPAERAERRRPLPDAFFDAVYDLGKKAESIRRLVDDDRFPQNAEKVAAKHRNDLLRTRALIDQVLAQLPQEE